MVTNIKMPIAGFRPRTAETQLPTPPDTPELRTFPKFPDLPYHLKLQILEFASCAADGRLVWRWKERASMEKDNSNPHTGTSLVGHFKADESAAQEQPMYRLSLVSRNIHGDFKEIPYKVNTMVFSEPAPQHQHDAPSAPGIHSWRFFCSNAITYQLNSLRRVEIDIGRLRFSPMPCSTDQSDVNDQVQAKLAQLLVSATAMPRCKFRLRVQNWKMEEYTDDVVQPSPLGINNYPPFLPHEAQITENIFSIIWFMERGIMIKEAMNHAGTDAKYRKITFVPTVSCTEPEVRLRRHILADWVEIALEWLKRGI